MKVTQLVLPIVLVLICGFIIHDLLVDTASLTLVNESAETIEDLEVKVWNQEFILGSLAPGASKKISLNGYSDSSWKISGDWKSGYQIRESVGYLTHGSDFSDRVAFTPGRNLVYASAR